MSIRRFGEAEPRQAGRELLRNAYARGPEVPRWYSTTPTRPTKGEQAGDMPPKWAIAVVVLCVVVTVAAVAYAAGKASDVPQVIRAQRFELVDEEGQVRSQLLLNEFGEACLLLYDAAGIFQIVLGFDEGDRLTELVLGSGKTSQPRLSLGVDPQTSRSEIRLSDKDGKLRATLALGTEGEPSLCFGQGSMREGKPTLLHMWLRDGEPQMQLRHSGGELIWSAP